MGANDVRALALALATIGILALALRCIAAQQHSSSPYLWGT
jgi:hypothetical protein